MNKELDRLSSELRSLNVKIYGARDLLRRYEYDISQRKDTIKELENKTADTLKKCAEVEKDYNKQVVEIREKERLANCINIKSHEREKNLDEYKDVLDDMNEFLLDFEQELLDREQKINKQIALSQQVISGAEERFNKSCESLIQLGVKERKINEREIDVSAKERKHAEDVSKYKREIEKTLADISAREKKISESLSYTNQIDTIKKELTNKSIVVDRKFNDAQLKLKEAIEKMSKAQEMEKSNKNILIELEKERKRIEIDRLRVQKLIRDNGLDEELKKLKNELDIK